MSAAVDDASVMGHSRFVVLVLFMYGHECSWGEDEVYRPPTKQLVEALRVKARALEDRIAEMHLGKETDDREAGPSATRRTGVPVPSDFRHIAAPALPHPTKSPRLALTERALAIGTDAANQPLNTYRFIFSMDLSIPFDDQSATVRQSFMCDWSRHLPVLDIQFTRFEHDTLLDLYFKYSSCWPMNVVPQLFLHDMLRALAHPTSPPVTEHYSPMLHCSLLAFATVLSDNPLIRQHSTREKFATRAKQFLHDDVHKPCLALVQALAVLSEYHCSLGERERGYMYLGVSIRAARAIGLGGAELSRPDQLHLAVISDWCFRSIYSQDKLMALDMNTDCDLRAADFSSKLTFVDCCPYAYTAGSAGAFEPDQSNGLTQVFSYKLMLIAESLIHSRMNSSINDFISSGHQNPSGIVEDNQALDIQHVDPY
ncbi:hypothetical protein FRC08_018001 [Ceratobasidium sp. 394]|nr:hypothetical protein FRC08_018001 [Ceratobasidium sp. 394]